MSLRKGILLLSIFGAVILTAMSSMASPQAVTSTSIVRVTINGNRVDFPVGSVFSARSCTEEICRVRIEHNGHSGTYAIQRNFLRLAGGDRIEARRGFWQNAGSTNNTELGGDENSTRINNGTPVAGGSSSFLSCYRTDGRRRYGRARSRAYCYRGVKRILQACGAVNRYLGGALAKNAGPELVASGFRKLSTMNPARAPLGSVIVYGNTCSSTHYAGHIEIKLGQNEYVSDYIGTRPRSSVTRCRPVLGIYMK